MDGEGEVMIILEERLFKVLKHRYGLYMIILNTTDDHDRELYDKKMLLTELKKMKKHGMELSLETEMWIAKESKSNG